MRGSATPEDPGNDPGSSHVSFAEAGRRGARKRWATHQRKIVRLDALDDEQRALVHAFVRMAEAVAAKDRERAA
jgi:hypothetical protein